MYVPRKDFQTHVSNPPTSPPHSAVRINTIRLSVPRRLLAEALVNDLDLRAHDVVGDGVAVTGN